MSSSPSPSSPRSPAAGSTRQMLDDLDALMQRMLALPVEQEEEAPAPAGQAASPSRAAEPALPVYSEPEPAPRPAPPRLVPAPRPAPPRAASSELPPLPRQAPPPAAVLSLTVPAGPLPAPAPVVEQPVSAEPPAARADGPEAKTGPHNLTPLGAEVFATLTVPASFRPRPTAPRRRAAARRLPPARDLLVRSLSWTNRAFDRGTEWLGEPGRWLRGRRGRAVLGWVGVGLLTIALGWQVLAWLGW